MKSLSFLRFDRAQRIGIALLLSLVIVLQLLYFYRIQRPVATEPGWKDWPEMDAALLKLQSEKPEKPRVFPFNPNFLTEYRAYRLGIPLEALDRLQSFRNQGKFVNSAAEFQKVTQLPDSVIARIYPLFKFPDWVNKRKTNYTTSTKFPRQDLNKADAAALEAVYGIGPVLAARILEVREKLGGFSDVQQLGIVYGLRPEVIPKARERFFAGPIVCKKLKINEAGLKEIAAFPYFNYRTAKAVITHRTMEGKIDSADELSKILDLDAHNLKILNLYLEF